MENFKFSQIETEGVIMKPTVAQVQLIEDRSLQTTGQPYLLLFLHQDDTSKIAALAIGKPYNIAKNLYKVGQEYTFPAGTFRARPRNYCFQSMSLAKYDLFFEEVRGFDKGSRFSRKVVVEKPNDGEDIVLKPPTV